mgnify:CR=1 FL=1
MHNINHSERLPYEKLAALGIDREKADSLPQEVKEKLASGEVTPLMQVSISARNGDIITLPLKLQLTTDQQGNPALMAYPVHAVLEKERNQVLQLSDQEAERLGKGEIIQKAVEVNGEKTRQYLQLDPETKSIFHRRVTDVQLEQKLKDMEKVNDIELGMQQKQQVREGKPIELNVGGEKVSVGVDLKEPQGFKVIQGDMKEWERQQKLRYDEQHPEFLGLVMTDKNRWEYQQVVDKQSTGKSLETPMLRKLNNPKVSNSKILFPMVKKNAEKDVGFVRQFNELKKKHPDAVLLFRKGDFYEMYKEDALKASVILALKVSDKILPLENPIKLLTFPRQ